MATVLFTVVGTAFGGPLGGAIGGLIGRQVDQAAFGSGAREGPRLKELSVTTSSYGQPIPRVFGRMRVAGTVIWSTELLESSETQGGKGQPKTTAYSYSASFAVALSSTPIARIGRIWADGNLLRGSNDDLKVEGEMRVYHGRGDNLVDPLIAAEKGGSATAFRDCAYVVFENLQLADFGNRIPALTFEVFASENAQVTLNALAPRSTVPDGEAIIEYARGFADDGGTIASALSAIDRVHPLTCVVSSEGLKIGARSSLPSTIPTLPRQLSSQNAEDAQERHKQRGTQAEREPLALRYYDEDRDYQPSVQRANGLRSDGREVMVDLPAVMTASGAKQLANANAHRSRWRAERVKWRVGQIDPGIQAGSVVRLPDVAGHWLVKSWEWFNRGIELELERLAPDLGVVLGSDAGIANPPADLPASITQLAAIEIPPDSAVDPALAFLFAVASANNENWSGAALSVEQGATLVSIGSTGSRRAVLGNLGAALSPTTSSYFQPNASLQISGIGEGLSFADTDLIGLANGANRLCVGGEVIQFASANEITPGTWILSGLLRGRGGTEDKAALGHAVGATVVLLDDRMTELDPSIVTPAPDTRIAAIGRGDLEPVYANVENAGLSRRPPIPVHPRQKPLPDDAAQFCWTRRARGYWRWDSLFEIPLVEQEELYRVGYGPSDAPYAIWMVSEANMTLSSTEKADLVSNYGPDKLWVRQIGTYEQSPPLHLATLS